MDGLAGTKDEAFGRVERGSDKVNLFPGGIWGWRGIFFRRVSSDRGRSVVLFIVNFLAREGAAVLIFRQVGRFVSNRMRFLLGCITRRT
jgi:hypothetical protein